MVQCFVFLSLLPPLMNFGSVTPIPIGIRVLVLNTPKDLIVQGMKAIRPNSFFLDVFLFTASFLILFISSYLNEFFFLNPFYPSP